MLAIAEGLQPSPEVKKEASKTLASLDPGAESRRSRLQSLIDDLFPGSPDDTIPPKARGLGTWEAGVAFSTGLDAEEENQKASSHRYHLFSTHRLFKPWQNNYHRTRLDLSRLESGPAVASLEHTLTHDHLQLPLTSRWSARTAIQNFGNIGGTARADDLALELSRSIHWTPRLSRRPSFRLHWAYQQVQPRDRIPSELLATEIYSRYRHDHAFQASLGEQWTWTQAENSQWSLTARLLGNHGEDFFHPDQGWLRLSWDFHLRQSIWRPSLRNIQRVNDGDRSSASSETVLALETWIIGPRKEARTPLLKVNLDHRFQSEETRLVLELSLYGDRYRRLRDHREGDPPFIGHWRNRFQHSP